MTQSTVARRSPLRRFRELFCFGVATALWLSTWAIAHTGFEGGRGRAAVLIIGLAEATVLSALFVLEARLPRPAHARRWITIAWASLPIWIALEFLVSAGLRATA